MSTAAPGSLQAPRLVAPCTRNVYTPGRQGGIGSQTLVASDFVPCVVQSFKLVAIPVGARAEIAESGEC